MIDTVKPIEVLLITGYLKGLTSRIRYRDLNFILRIYIRWLHLMCNIFLRNLCFASCPFCALLRKNFNSKMTKMNGNGSNMVFKVIKLTPKTFLLLISKILPLFTINWVHPVQLNLIIGGIDRQFIFKTFKQELARNSIMCN